MFLQYVFVLLGNAVTIVNTNVLFKTDNSDKLLDGITNLVILAKGEKRINKLDPRLEKMLLSRLSIFTLNVLCIKQLQGNNRSSVSKSSFNFKIHKQILFSCMQKIN